MKEEKRSKNFRETSIDLLKPYEHNARTHSDEQIEKICRSIEEFGFINPVIVDKNNMIVAGHGRVLAARKLGIKTVPTVSVEHLSDEQVRAYIIADNRLAEDAGWDMELVNKELEDLSKMNFNVEITGFDFVTSEDWFNSRERFDNSGIEEESEEYQEFVEKFEQKKTTDDCYTPDVVYDAIAKYVKDRYCVDDLTFIRPFYPGGDYKKERYMPGAVVVDNPPFSIISEIVRWYSEKGIKFFLFAPALTLLSSAAFECCTAISVGGDITYENGANVLTSFLTNLEDKNIAAKSDPELYKIIKDANNEVLKSIHKPQRKYSYPDEVMTSTMLSKYSKYGIDIAINKNECVRISGLDEQKESGDAIFGGGLLLSERAAAERAAAERAAAERAAAEQWKLTEREKEIVNNLGGNNV